MGSGGGAGSVGEQAELCSGDRICLLATDSADSITFMSGSPGTWPVQPDGSCGDTPSPKRWISRL